MSTNLVWEGNIGNPPEYKQFPNGNNEPRRMMRLNVHFDNSFPDGKGGWTERGSFWANVELWSKDAEHLASLFQKGMRVQVTGRAIMDKWEKDGEQVQALKVDASRIAIVPQRVAQVVMQASSHQASSQQRSTPQQQQSMHDDMDQYPGGDYGASF